MTGHHPWPPPSKPNAQRIIQEIADRASGLTTPPDITTQCFDDRDTLVELAESLRLQVVVLESNICRANRDIDGLLAKLRQYEKRLESEGKILGELTTILLRREVELQSDTHGATSNVASDVAHPPATEIVKKPR